MATYESRYQQLGFYVDGGFRRFSGGLFHTDDPAEIVVLDTITDVVRIDEKVPEEPVKPAPKPRKAANTSAK
ncbi:hypothetical protein [Paenibacillus sp. VTT E-133291]|uniref:hypothetical protein n=1 Tax=Paenibacillus sp. VTT E-133291 TaxID=1986223 RepID=UPI000BA02018|nr:hypothetical protein [Paenibacillus sp. VTT E-133291]OZQ74663.1 hypothetical protein CA598_31440 [Paenibacillus sp. VTT E-133291]